MLGVRLMFVISILCFPETLGSLNFLTAVNANPGKRRLVTRSASCHAGYSTRRNRSIVLCCAVLCCAVQFQQTMVTPKDDCGHYLAMH